MRAHHTPPARQNWYGKSHNPDHATPAGYHTWNGLALSAFARHYKRNHYCFLFLRVLRCFTSPRSLHAPYVFRCGSPDHSRVWRGFPIRTPWDHSPVNDSPRLIADSYVLLRLLMPRHPPCALKNLTTKDQGVISREPQKPPQHPKAQGQIQVHILGNCFL